MLTVASLGLALPALAGDVVARAGQNPNVFIDSNPGAEAVATWPANAQGGMAYASATRRWLTMGTIGHGGSATFHYNAYATSNSRYEFVDLSTFTTLDPVLAASLDLSFNFRLDGHMDVEPVSLSNATIQWSAMLAAGGHVASGGTSANLVFGPVPPFPRLDYVFLGDERLRDDFDLSFSLRHVGAADGSLSMMIAGQSGNRAVSRGMLQLTGITMLAPLSDDVFGQLDQGLLDELAVSHRWDAGAVMSFANAGSMTAIGGSPLAIGLRFIETGEIVPIFNPFVAAPNAVPEPAVWVMVLIALAAAGTVKRRR